jgi:hypothetical protein
VIIDFVSVPNVTGLEEDCNAINTGYTVAFSIEGGTGPYMVNGMPVGGATYSSSEIPAGTPYAFTIIDANGCAAQDLSGLLECNCSTMAGEMNITEIAVCIDAIAAGEYLGGSGLDGNDTIAFALHDGTFPAGIIQWNSLPEFAFVQGMVPGITYYITAVAGNIGPGGLPDIADPCLHFSAGTPVVFHDFPAVDAGTDEEIGCDPAMISLKGTSDALFPEFFWNGTNGGAISGPADLAEVTAISAGVYVLSVKDSLNGCIAYDTTIVVQHEISLSALSIDRIDPVCFNDCNGIIMVGGAATWNYALGLGTYSDQTVFDATSDNWLRLPPSRVVILKKSIGNRLSVRDVRS